MTLPTIFKRASDGSIQQWTIEVYGDSIDGQPVGVIETTYGKLDGAQQFTKDVIRKGKNIGRSNETTAVEQAVAEAQSKWETQLKKGYVRTIEEAREGKTDSIIAGGVEPMLAHSYDKHAAKIRYPAFAQPKLDGHRCVAVIQNGTATLWSRTRKRITGVPHIARQLEQAFPTDDGSSIVLDGELYNHDYAERFEELTSFIRSATPKPGHEVVEYHVYDVIEEGATMDERASFLRVAAAENTASKLVFLAPETVEDEEGMVALFGEYVADSYEGLMLRNAAGLYKHGRSYDLQKVKTMQDAEFELVDIESGRGKMQGKAVFHCATPSGDTFKCKLVGRLDDLEQYLQEPDKWIGRMVTVQFQNLSATGIPRFPVALRFREDV